MLRLSSGQHFEMLLDFSELLFVFELMLDLALILWVVLIWCGNDSNDQFLELFASHEGILVPAFIDISLREDTRIECDGLGSVQVVTRAHADCHSSPSALCDCLFYAIAQGILKTKDAYHCQILLQHLFVLNCFKIVVLLFQGLEIMKRNILVSNHNCSQGFRGKVMLDHLVHYFPLLFLCHLSSTLSSSHILGARLKNKLRCALNKDSDQVSLLGHSGHRLLSR